MQVLGSRHERQILRVGFRLPVGSPTTVDRGERQRILEDELNGWNLNRISVLDQQAASDHCVTEYHLKGFESLPHRQFSTTSSEHFQPPTFIFTSAVAARAEAGRPRRLR